MNDKISGSSSGSLLFFESKGKEIKYWTTKLSENVNASRFPPAYVEELSSEKGVGVLWCAVDNRLAARLETACPDDRALLVVLMTGIFVQLRYWLEQSCFCLAALNRRKNGNLQLLPLVLDCPGSFSFREALHLVRRLYMEAAENADCPLPQLWESLAEGMSGKPMPGEIAFSVNTGVLPEQLILEQNRELVFCFERTDREWKCGIGYDTSVYQPVDAERLFSGYQQLLMRCLSEPDQELDRLDLLPEEDAQLWRRINDTAVDYPVTESIGGLFGRLAAAFADKVALQYGEQQLTYRKLDRLTDEIAGHLTEMEVGLNKPVAVLLDADHLYIIAILAILKAGGVYLPLACTDPSQRINALLEDIGTDLVLTGTRAVLENQIDTAALEKEGRRLVYIDGLNGEPVFQQDQPRPFDLAYILFTSGSTGRPKGVPVSHRNILRLVCNNPYIPFSPEMRLLLTGALTFDATTFEIWGCLLNGGTLVLIDKEELLDFDRVNEVLCKEDINTLWLTSALFNQMAQQETRNIFAPVRYLITGGDILSPKHFNSVRERNPALRIVGAYGPTENTTFSHTHPINRSYTHKIPIGLPIANSTAYILDSKGKLCPVASWGTLYVGGDGLFRGYLNNPELSQDRLIPDPYSAEAGAMLYNTGDIVRLLPDGNMEFHGRNDDQVKIRGYRIATGEIERQLTSLDGISEAAVVIKENGGEKQLVAYYVTGEDFSAAMVKRALTECLPAHMIPSCFIRIGRLPLTPNGKLDRKALLSREDDLVDVEVPSSELEEQLLQLCMTVLQKDRHQFGVTTNFFDAGGHSLKASVLINKIRQQFEVGLTIKDLFSNPTVRGLAFVVSQKMTTEVII